MVLGIGGLLAVTYGAAIAGSEWGWGTLKTAVARGEGRVRYTLANYAAIAIFTWIGILFAFLVGVLVSAIGATISGVSLSGMGDQDALLALPEQLARGRPRDGDERGARVRDRDDRPQPARRHRRGHRAVLRRGDRVDLRVRPDQVVPVRRVERAHLGQLGLRRGRGRRQPGFVETLDPTTAIWVVAVWLVASLAVASIWTERAEISG